MLAIVAVAVYVVVATAAVLAAGPVVTTVAVSVWEAVAAAALVVAGPELVAAGGTAAAPVPVPGFVTVAAEVLEVTEAVHVLLIEDTVAVHSRPALPQELPRNHQQCQPFAKYQNVADVHPQIADAAAVHSQPALPQELPRNYQQCQPFAKYLDAANVHDGGCHLTKTMLIPVVHAPKMTFYTGRRVAKELDSASSPFLNLLLGQRLCFRKVLAAV